VLDISICGENGIVWDLGPGVRVLSLPYEVSQYLATCVQVPCARLLDFLNGSTVASEEVRSLEYVQRAAWIHTIGKVGYALQ
jgi:hypothetical protein